ARSSVISAIECCAAEAVERRGDGRLVPGFAGLYEALFREERSSVVVALGRCDPTEVCQCEDAALAVADLPAEGRGLLQARQCVLVIALSQCYAAEPVHCLRAGSGRRGCRLRERSF